MPTAAATRPTAGSCLELPADGAYRVAATSFRPGETGAYRLSGLRPGRRCRGHPRRSAAEPIAIGADRQRPPRRGRRPARRRANIPTITGSAPGAASGSRIALTGGKLDPYLLLARPDGTSDANDDSRGRRPALAQQPDRHRARRGRRLCDHRHLLPARRDRRLSPQPRAEPRPSAPDRRPRRRRG